jgi:hypothetical protein
MAEGYRPYQARNTGTQNDAFMHALAGLATSTSRRSKQSDDAQTEIPAGSCHRADVAHDRCTGAAADNLRAGRQGHWPRHNRQPGITHDLRCRWPGDRSHLNRQRGHDDDL